MTLLSADQPPFPAPSSRSRYVQPSPTEPNAMRSASKPNLLATLSASLNQPQASCFPLTKHPFDVDLVRPQADDGIGIVKTLKYL